MVKGFFFLVLLGILLSTSAAGQCGQRDASGTWSVLLGEFKREIVLDLKQSGSEISGTARPREVDLRFEEVTVKGTVTGDKISFIIDSKNSTRVNGVSLLEEFKGDFGPDGKITGRADVFTMAGTVKVDWISDRPMRCLYNTVKKLGTKPSTTEPTASSTKAPWITAVPNNIMLPPGIATGQSTIAWDGGKDHPYAEVWVRVDNEDERKLLEQGRGTLPVVVVPGKTYVYILTDAGTTLATVTVRFPR